MKIEEKQGGLTFVGGARDVDASQESAAKRRPASSVAVGLRFYTASGAYRLALAGSGEPAPRANRTRGRISTAPLAELRFAMFLKRARSRCELVNVASLDSKRAASQ